MLQSLLNILKQQQWKIVMRKSSNILMGIKIIAFLLEMISIGLSNKEIVEKTCEHFNIDKEELEKYL